MQIINEKLAKNSAAYLNGYVRTPDKDTGRTEAPAILIIPGGSYTHISEAQAETMAQAFLAQGYQSFFLRYSFVDETTPLLPQPLIELAQAVTTIREQAAVWHIDPDKIVLAGFSVGGHMAALYNDFWSTTWFQDLTGKTAAQLKIKAAIISYAVIDPQLGFPTDEATIAKWTPEPEKYAAQKHVTPANVPSFVWATVTDQLVPVQNSLAYANALMAHGVDCELHLFHEGPHGMALANSLTARRPEADDAHVAHWFELANEWLKTILTAK